MVLFAIYQYGYSVLGIGLTVSSAKADAINNGYVINNVKNDRQQVNIGDIVVIPITEDLYKHVTLYGGNVSIEKNLDGLYSLDS